MEYLQEDIHVANPKDKYSKTDDNKYKSYDYSLNFFQWKFCIEGIFDNFSVEIEIETSNHLYARPYDITYSNLSCKPSILAFYSVSM